MCEAHALPLAFGETQLASEGGGLQHHAPALAQDRSVLARTGAPRDLRRQLFARQHTAGQRLRERRNHLLELVLRDAEILEPGLLEEMRVGRERAEKER